MSYVSTLEDIKELYDEFYEVSEKLSCVLDDTTNNSTLSEEDIVLCLYLSSKLDVDRHELKIGIQQLFKGKEDK